MFSRYGEIETFDIDAMSGHEWIAKDGSEVVFASHIDRAGRIGPFGENYVSVPRDSFVITTRDNKLRLLSGNLMRTHYAMVCDDN